MRILFLCRHSLNKTAGGMVEYLQYLPPELKKLGIEVVLYDMSNVEDNTLKGPFAINNGVKSYSGPVIKPSIFVSPKKIQALRNLCQLEKIDLVHAQGAYRSGFAALELFKATRQPYVVMSHGDLTATNSDRLKRGKILRRCRKILQNAKHVIHLTPIMAEASHQIFDTRNKSTIIGNGVNLSKWVQVDSNVQNYLFCIGRLEKEKGFHVLVDAYAKLRQQGIKTSLVIAGDGNEALALQSQAKALGLNVVLNHQSEVIPEESIVFTGYVGGDLKHQLMANCKLILFPTQPNEWEEPFGIVQIEAMAASKVLVASDSRTTRYLQDLGLQASLAIPHDPGSWADKIAMLLREDKIRESLAKKNREHVLQFDWKEIAKQYQSMYQNIT